MYCTVPYCLNYMVLYKSINPNPWILTFVFRQSRLVARYGGMSDVTRNGDMRWKTSAGDIYAPRNAWPQERRQTPVRALCCERWNRLGRNGTVERAQPGKRFEPLGLRLWFGLMEDGIRVYDQTDGLHPWICEAVLARELYTSRDARSGE